MQANFMCDGIDFAKYLDPKGERSGATVLQGNRQLK